jgi:sugar/nucleoside kinase (ribokinase family)
MLSIVFACIEPEKNGVPEISVAFGGGATNAAVSFSRLGLRTAMIGAVGHDGRGLAIIRNLAKHKVNSLMVETISNAHTFYLKKDLFKI